MDDEGSWPGPRLAFLFLGVLAVVVVDAIERLDAFVRFQATLDPPLVGVWSHPEPVEAAFFATTAMLIAFAVTFPALWFLQWFGRSNGVPLDRIVTALFAGAIVAGSLSARLPPLIRGVTGIEPPDGTATNATTVGLAPVVEDTLLLAATAVVLLAKVPRRGLRVGLLLGTAVGLGLNVIETVSYALQDRFVDSDASAVQTIALRFGLLGFSLHATTAAVSGAGLGAWLSRGGRGSGLGLMLGGLALAIGVHAVWNRYAEDVINGLLNGLPSSVDPFVPLTLFLTASFTAIPFLIVPWTVLLVAWRRSGRTLGGIAVDDALGTDRQRED